MNGLCCDLPVAMNHNAIDIFDGNRLLGFLSVFVFRGHDERFAAATDARLGSANVQRLLLPKRRKQRGSFLCNLGFSTRGIGYRVRWFGFSIYDGEIRFETFFFGQADRCE